MFVFDFHIIGFHHIGWFFVTVFQTACRCRKAVPYGTNGLARIALYAAAGFFAGTPAVIVKSLQPLFRADRIQFDAVVGGNLVDNPVHDVDVVGAGGNHRQFVVEAAQVELADGRGMTLFDQEAARTFVKAFDDLELGIGQLQPVDSYSLKILNIYSFNSKLEIRGTLKHYCIRGVLI